MHRLFLAIRPPQDIRDRLVDRMDDSPVLRWIPDDNLHLTLRFVGEVERPVAEDLAAALAQVRFEPFDVTVRGVGQFDRRAGGAIWVGIEPRTEIAALAASVDRACQRAGQEPEQRAFHPHITVARYRRAESEAARDFVRRNTALEAGTFRVDEFRLYESRLSRHGALYDEVAAYPAIRTVPIAPQS